MEKLGARGFFSAFIGPLASRELKCVVRNREGDIVNNETEGAREAWRKF